MYRLALSGVLLAGLLLAAPAPLPRAKTPDQITAGDWRLYWQDMPYVMCLRQDGSCNTSGIWYGRWEWNESSRTLSIWEDMSFVGDDLKCWQVRLDSRMAGRAAYVWPEKGEQVAVRLPAGTERKEKVNGEQNRTRNDDAGGR